MRSCNTATAPSSIPQSYIRSIQESTNNPGNFDTNNVFRIVNPTNITTCQTECSCSGDRRAEEQRVRGSEAMYGSPSTPPITKPLAIPTVASTVMVDSTWARIASGVPGGDDCAEGDDAHRAEWIGEQLLTDEHPVAEH